MMLRLILDARAAACLVECMKLSGVETTGEVFRDALACYRAILEVTEEFKIKDAIYEDSITGL